jgi:uncharacterized phage infection (PIP) family protein YhgE
MNIDDLKELVDPDKLQLLAAAMKGKDVDVPVSDDLLGYCKETAKSLDKTVKQMKSLENELEQLAKEAMEEKGKFWLVMSDFLGVHPRTPMRISDNDDVLTYNKDVAEMLDGEEEDEEILENRKKYAKEIKSILDGVTTYTAPTSEEDKTTNAVDFESLLQRS